MSSGKIGRSMLYKDLLSGIIHCKKGVMSSYNEIFKFSGSEYVWNSYKNLTDVCVCVSSDLI